MAVWLSCQNIFSTPPFDALHLDTPTAVGYSMYTKFIPSVAEGLRVNWSALQTTQGKFWVVCCTLLAGGTTAHK